jgi:cyclase
MGRGIHIIAGATLLAGTTLWVPSAMARATPLETSVEKAQAMLIQEDLGDGIFVFRAPSDLDYWTSTNSVVIVNDDDVTVFDSCTRAVTARAVIAEIRKLTSKPVRVLINSHWHQDHWSGNGEYARAFPGLRIIASAETRAYMSRMGPRFFVDELEQAGLVQMRSDLAEAVKSGKLADGSPLTAEERARKERSVAMGNQFADEIEALPRVLPNVTYQGEMAFWSGRREFRLMSVTGDAVGSTVLYLPGSKVIVAGDALASPEDGKGPPPWTMGGYGLTAWIGSLRRLEALDAAAIVPGQGPVMRDKAYLRRTIGLFAAIVDQVHAALERGTVKLSQVSAAVNVDDIARAYAPGVPLGDDFHVVVAMLEKKAMQEALDGNADEK